MVGEARRSISARLMIEIDWTDSMIGVLLLVVDMAADRPVAVTTMVSPLPSGASASAVVAASARAWAKLEVPAISRQVKTDRWRIKFPSERADILYAIASR
jgi:hypothetical protein